MENHAAEAFSPRIYCIDPTLVGDGGWSDLFARCAGMGFDHVLLCGDGLIAGLFAGDDENLEDAAAGYGMGSLDHLEELAHLATEHRLRLLLDLSVTRIHHNDQLLHSHPEWFAVADTSSLDGGQLPDPRRRDGGACKDLTPPGTFSGKRSPKQQSDALRFAECVRENGVKDFPDPVNGEPLVDTRRIPSTDGEGGMTILNAAMHKCRALVADAAGSRP